MTRHVLGCSLIVALALAPVSAGADEAPAFVTIIERHAQSLAAVTSDTEALALFSSRLAPALGLSASVPSDQQQAAGQLVAELAAWRLAAAVRMAADADDRAALPALIQSASAQRNWLFENDRFLALRLVFLFHDTHLPEEPGRSPRLAGLAFRAEAEAERNARLLWERLQSWNDRIKAQKSAARLCGTWQWTIHNHKNHLERKTAVVFLAPGTPAPPDMPQPAKMVVLGDAVYLRWDFQGGYQEDSLLFVKEGKHLEGTFTNTAGDWGAITGKRVATCGK